MQRTKILFQDTITVTFSTTKAAAALAVALLYEQGKLSYDDPVSKYWPGFGTHGRNNVTIQMALSHMVIRAKNQF